MPQAGYERQEPPWGMRMGPEGRSEETSMLRERASQLFVPLVGEPSPFEAGPAAPLYGQQRALAGFGDEATLVVGVLSRLAPWFHVRREVWGRHPTGVRCRIDAMLTPRDSQRWKDPKITLGVEFKSWYSHVQNAARKDTTGWVAQAIDYSMVEWDGTGRVPIFMCPDPFKRNRTETDSGLHPVATFVDGLLGKYNVGYLALFNGVGLALLMHGNHMIWSERYGVSNGRTWTLRPRAGRRH